MSSRPRACLLVAAVLTSVASPARADEDARLEGSSRGARNGWITVRLQGAPSAIGYQHGTLLAREIEDAVAVARLGYYTATLDADGRSGAPDKCSAFVATGRYTRDGRPVVAHNNWSGYLEGSRWNVIFDIRPTAGRRILMDGMPGLIHSGDDFGVTSAGLVITEMTITGFKGFLPAGIPEFARARKAMQYAATMRDLVASPWTLFEAP